jgi:hypothetical protein
LQDLAEATWVEDVQHALASDALAWDVGDEHLREGVEEGRAVGAAGDEQRGTHAVRFSVAKLIEPSPNKGGIATGNFLRNRHVELPDALL